MYIVRRHAVFLYLLCSCMYMFCFCILFLYCVLVHNVSVYLCILYLCTWILNIDILMHALFIVIHAICICSQTVFVQMNMLYPHHLILRI